jgi:hypothetical protein
MWMGFAVAPVVGPIAFVLWLAIVFLFSTALNISVNTASVAVMTGIAVTVGIPASYAVAGLFGMPLAFFLRNRGRLNAFTIHSSALCISGIVAVCCQFLIVLEDVSLTARIIALIYVFLLTVVPILLSAMTFWLIVRCPPEDKTN